MNANRNKLALRRQSIRNLTSTELQVAHGGSLGAPPGSWNNTYNRPFGGPQTGAKATTIRTPRTHDGNF
jgi:hypothetical protein